MRHFQPLPAFLSNIYRSTRLTKSWKVLLAQDVLLKNSEAQKGKDAKRYWSNNSNSMLLEIFFQLVFLGRGKAKLNASFVGVHET